MGTKHPNPNLVKIHLTYSVDEIARRLSISKGTVRRWLMARNRCAIARCAGA